MWGFTYIDYTKDWGPFQPSAAAYSKAIKSGCSLYADAAYTQGFTVSILQNFGYPPLTSFFSCLFDVKHSDTQ